MYLTYLGRKTSCVLLFCTGNGRVVWVDDNPLLYVRVQNNGTILGNVTRLLAFAAGDDFLARRSSKPSLRLSEVDILLLCFISMNLTTPGVS